MHRIPTLLIVELLALTLFQAVLHGQGAFQNLDFESATVGPDPSPRTVSFTSALPGWAGDLSGSQLTSALYNDRFLDAAAIGLVGPGSQFTGVPIAGQYTAFLQGGSSSLSPNASLRQTGIVPADSMSLRFFGLSSRGNFIVSMNDQALGVIALQDFGNYREYGANIAGFAGQSAELRFTQPGGVSGPNQYGIFFLDQISFSPIAIPEPSTWALLALGSALFWCAARRHRN